MPVHRVGKNCYQWGGSGKVYCGPGARQKAERQGRAAYAHGYRGHAAEEERRDHMEIRIPDMPMWEQIGGDMDPAQYGGTIAKSDGDALELLKIQPVREYVGDAEAADVGFPFWTREAYYTLEDLDPENEDVKDALRSIGMTLDELSEDAEGRKAAGERGYTPEQRALVIAEALLDYGVADEGPAGWSSDIYGDSEVKWWRGGVETLADRLHEEDEDFRREVLGEEDEEDEEEDEEDEEEYEDDEYGED